MSTVLVENGNAEAKAPLLPDVLKNKSWQLLAAISILSVFVIYWPTLTWWWEKWWAKESYYSHGVLVPVISGFVIYFERERLAQMRVKPSVWGLAILIPVALIQLISQMKGVPSVAGMTLPVVLAAVSLLLFGKEVTMALAFPLAFLYFMCVPPSNILEPLSFKLRLLSTTVAAMVLKLVGYHATQTGTSIIMPNFAVDVAAKCSGVRILISLLAFTSFFAFMKKGPLWGRIGLVLFVVPLSLIANAIRVTMNSIVGENFGSDAMKNFDFWAGIIVLAISFAILTVVARMVKCREFKSMP